MPWRRRRRAAIRKGEVRRCSFIRKIFVSTLENTELSFIHHC
jgi:hypothetical protein